MASSVAAFLSCPLPGLTRQSIIKSIFEVDGCADQVRT
ncbi:hypothetical protein CSIRO_1834 [Bradyrhizobiaceae bacterium SG-6C]|nr:hypothetical protein CSIRO_1834 [Bradyrhizobiaceae bacterium SG-6C]